MTILGPTRDPRPPPAAGAAAGGSAPRPGVGEAFPHAPPPIPFGGTAPAASSAASAAQLGSSCGGSGEAADGVTALLSRPAAPLSHEDILRVLSEGKRDIRHAFSDWIQQLGRLQDEQLRQQQSLIDSLGPQRLSATSSDTGRDGRAKPLNRGSLDSVEPLGFLDPPPPSPIGGASSRSEMHSAPDLPCIAPPASVTVEHPPAVPAEAWQQDFEDDQGATLVPTAPSEQLCPVLPGSPDDNRPATAFAGEGRKIAKKVVHLCDQDDTQSFGSDTDNDFPKKDEHPGEASIRRLSSESSKRSRHSQDSGVPNIRQSLPARRSTVRMQTMDQESPDCDAQVWLRLVVNSTAFSVVSLTTILTNAVYIGIQTDIMMRSTLERYRDGSAGRDEGDLNTIELLFCLFFTCELLLRLCASPRFFLYGIDWRWNFFDAVLVSTCIADIALVSAKVDSSSISYVRILRVVRTARILRIIRVMRFFRSLRLMVYSIINSMQELLWVFVLLFFFIYVTAIFIASTVTEHHIDRQSTPYDPNNANHVTICSEFGTVPDTAISLFSAISGGRDWASLFTPLLEMNMLCGLVFVCYIFFVVFGVLNVVTGAFVDSIRLVSQRDNDLVIEEELKKVNTFKTEITDIFESADSDESGTLSWDEFETHLQDERVRAYFASLELDISEAKALFRLLDVEETDEIPIDKFVQGCLRMRGDAKSIDVNMILYENEKMLLKLTQFTDHAEEQFEQIMYSLKAARSHLNHIAGDQAKIEEKETQRTRQRNSKLWLEERRKSYGNMDQIAPSMPGILTRRKSLGGGRLEAALNVISACEPLHEPV